MFWTDRAEARLDAFLGYIAGDVPGAAKALERRLILRSLQIGKFPHSGRKVPDYDRDDVRELIVGSYRLVYRIKVDHVDVLTVMRCAQLLPTDAERL